jgi:hypothetical protein
MLVGTIIAGSFLIPVAPLGTASSAAAGMMDCCVGKPGRVPGSCATGLLASAKKSQSDSPASFDHAPASPSEFSLIVVAGAGSGEHCHAPTADTPTSTDTLSTGPETMLKPAEPESDSLVIEASAGPTAESGLNSLHAVSQPCTENCGACSTSVTRRPREQSALSIGARSHKPSVRRFSSGSDLQIRPLNRKWLHLRPRAPPS